MSSRRYTPKTDPHELDSPAWWPWFMVGLFAIGGLAIMSRYLIFTDSNIPMIVGLARPHGRPHRRHALAIARLIAPPPGLWVPVGRIRTR